MDDLTYHYYTGSTNKLEYITDAVGAQAYAGDVDNMQAGNYQYDAIGNIIADASAGITHISWTVYGKIQSIQKADGTTINYTYDATGNRISKAVSSSGNTVTTWYVRDAQGNVLDVYTAGNSSLNNGHLSQTEIDLYGSARLGMLNSTVDVENAAPANVTTLPGLDAAFNSTFVRGNKLFELSNHLGNVLITVSDRHGVFSNDNSTVDHYEPVVLNATDYYPFGMEMPGRVFSGGGYRYGFMGRRMIMR